MPSGPIKKRVAKCPVKDKPVDAVDVFENNSNMPEMTAADEAASEKGSNKKKGKESESVVNQVALEASLIEPTVENTEGNESTKAHDGQVSLEETLMETASKKSETKELVVDQLALEVSLVEPTLKKTEKNKSVDDQLVLEESINEPASKKSETDKLVVDQLTLEESLSKKSETNESVHHQLALEESLIGHASNKTDDQMVPEEFLIQPTPIKTGKNKSVDFCERSSHDPISMVDPVLSNLTESDRVSLESALEGLSLGPPVHPIPEQAERPTSLAHGRPKREKKLPFWMQDYYVSPLNKSKKK